VRGGRRPAAQIAAERAPPASRAHAAAQAGYGAAAIGV